MFYPLSEKNAVDYLKGTPVYKEHFDGVDELKAVDLAEGNINLVFRISGGRGPAQRSVLVKQALPHARKYPDFKMPQERALKEYEVLLLEWKYCPGLVPRVYYHDAGMFANLMEDLNRHVIMRCGLMKQVRYERFAGDIGTFLARTLFHTSDLFLPSAEKKQMVARFINPVMCKVTEDLVFTEPFIEHPNNHWTPQLTPQVMEIRADDGIRSEVLALKQSFMTEAQALIHGDLHTGSIMVNENETRVIDPEFCFFGPMGFDIGAVLGNLALSHASQLYHAPDARVRKDYQRWLAETIRGAWEAFEKDFRALLDTRLIEGQWSSTAYKEQYLTRILRDAAGFGAAKMIRRIIGMAHVPDMWEIPEDRDRAAAETVALRIACAWLRHRSTITAAQDLVDMIVEARPHPKVAVQ